MIKEICLFISGLIGAFLIYYFKKKISEKTKNIVKEKWDTAKFLDGITSLTDPKKWGQTLSWWLNFRNLIVVGIIVGAIFGYGYWKGKSGKPINFNLNYEKEFALKLDGHTLYKPKNSRELQVKDDNGNIIKIVAAKDIPQLQKAMCPYGFQFKPYFSIGTAITKDDIKEDYGIGISWLKYFKYSLSNWVSNNAIWIGLDYKLTDNFYCGAGIGKSYKGESPLGIRGRFDF